MKINIVDTTLRDGEQRPGIAFRSSEKIYIAKMLSNIGTYQIEAGIPAMGGDEKNYIMKLMELGLKSRISAWNRMNINDIKDSIDCTPDIIHISIPSSDIQINKKLQKNRIWVEENMKRCISFAKDKGYEVTIGLEDASRADPEFLMRIIGVACAMGIKRIRYADTVGVLYRQGIYNQMIRIKRQFSSIELEIHAHNDLGMAVSNSISAVKAGALYVDCTLGGIGERAGNCDYLKFVTAAKAIHGFCSDINLKKVARVQKSFLGMVKAVEFVS
ncbi:beta/alpha barrel domain-containing protein [Acetivibrio cellulolyticus]|uniref:homocitrate synthase n=1 Tax=Acetivibrio cellulolyticus TaxID=35830 RepID=UPI0001E2BDA8|nr:homocitrate synthase [Acetivibrio cellulolyticus]